METKTYLIKTKYDYSTNELVNVDGNNLTIEFKIMDKYTMIEIIGRLKDRTVEEFKHQIICNKNQNIQVLPNANEQVEKFDNRINDNVDRICGRCSCIIFICISFKIFYFFIIVFL